MTIRVHSSAGAILAGALAFFVCGTGQALEDGQRTPKRLYSNGDSITRAYNANLPLDNLNLSWVNGYYGFWQWLFRLPDVAAHNQRIDANFGRWGRRNWIAAQTGARMEALAGQAAGTEGRTVTYSTVLMGANDLCANGWPVVAGHLESFRTAFADGLHTLVSRLPSGATVQVAAIPDLGRLYRVAQDKRALGIADCTAVLEATALCSALLVPRIPDIDVEDWANELSALTARYNDVLQEVVDGVAATAPGQFISYTDASFTSPFTEIEVSDLDCFHPSWEGQRLLSRETWENGPFREHIREP